MVRLGANESPLGPSPKALQAIRDGAAESHRYPPITDDVLRDAIAGILPDGLTSTHLVTGNGACDILDMIARAFLGPEESCVICRPTFPVYEMVSRRRGARVTFCDLDRPEFTYSPDAILEAAGERSRVVFICSPNNPTGTLFTREALQILLGGLPERTLIVFDQVYHHFVTDPAQPDPLHHIAAGRPNVIVLGSFSKAYGLAGCRLGYGVGPPEIMEEIRRFRLPFHINALTVRAGLAALTDLEHITRTVDMVTEGRGFLVENLRRLGVPVWPSQGNFVLFQPADAAAALQGLQDHGVIVRPMDNFYLPGHLRVTVGLPEENTAFVKALTRTLGRS